MEEWRRFVVKLRARTQDEILLWSVDLADALAKRMATLPRDSAVAVAGVVYRGMSEALAVEPSTLFGLLAEEGYLGDTQVTVLHVTNEACECEACQPATNAKDLN